MNTSPAERLAVSREHLRLALQAPGTARPNDANLLAGLRSLPGAEPLCEAVGLWWNRHPWRAAGLLVAEAAKGVVAPLAQHHPLLLVVGAFAFGGLLAWSRPWRWGFKSALFAGLMPQLLSSSLAHWQRRADAAPRPSNA